MSLFATIKNKISNAFLFPAEKSQQSPSQKVHKQSQPLFQETSQPFQVKSHTDFIMDAILSKLSKQIILDDYEEKPYYTENDLQQIESQLRQLIEINPRISKWEDIINFYNETYLNYSLLINPRHLNLSHYKYDGLLWREFESPFLKLNRERDQKSQITLAHLRIKNILTKIRPLFPKNSNGNIEYLLVKSELEKFIQWGTESSHQIRNAVYVGLSYHMVKDDIAKFNLKVWD